MITKAANDVAAAAARDRDDPYVARAIAAMKGSPARRWSITELARVAGLSRAPFARRFHRATGTSPLRYLTDLRMKLAAARLVTTDDGLAAIGAYVGYTSEFAFAKAFKRRLGVAPGAYRRHATHAPITMMRAA